MSVGSIARGIFTRASKVSVLRHFVFAFAAAYLIAAGPVVSHFANDLVQGQAVSGGDAKALVVAAEIAIGTALMGVVVPELGLLAVRASRAAKR